MQAEPEWLTVVKAVAAVGSAATAITLLVRYAQRLKGMLMWGKNTGIALLPGKEARQVAAMLSQDRQRGIQIEPATTVFGNYTPVGLVQWKLGFTVRNRAVMNARVEVIQGVIEWPSGTSTTLPIQPERVIRGASAHWYSIDLSWVPAHGDLNWCVCQSRRLALATVQPKLQVFIRIAGEQVIVEDQSQITVVVVDRN